MKIFENLTNIKFRFQREKPNESNDEKMTIYKNDEIFITIHECDRRRPPDVNVDQFKRSFTFGESRNKCLRLDLPRKQKVHVSKWLDWMGRWCLFITWKTTASCGWPSYLCHQLTATWAKWSCGADQSYWGIHHGLLGGAHCEWLDPWRVHARDRKQNNSYRRKKLCE